MLNNYEFVNYAIIFLAIQTAAIEMLSGSESFKFSRKPDIMADAAYAIITKDAKTTTGNFFIDEDVLLAEGITDFKQYACDPSMQCFTLNDNIVMQYYFL